MKLTEEQKEIIQAIKNNKERIKINAFAGTGKTTTLLEIAKTNRDKKILYLAFNKAIAEEAKKKFPPNVKILTTHALAYKYVVLPNNYELQDLKAVTLMSLYNIDYEEAIKIKSLFEFFNNSNLTFEKLKIEEEIKKILADLTLKMINKELPITHDFYVKQFSMLLKMKKIKIEYDIILLDEAQDTNDVTLEIFDLIKAKQKIIVGDKHQQIYSFRGSKNALLKFEGEEYYLSNSFRFNQNIADSANHTLNLFKGEKVKIKGLGEKKDITNYAIISRTNSSLIEVIGELENKNIYFKTIRRPYEIFGLAINLYKLYLNQPLDNNFLYLNNFKKYTQKNILDFIEEKATQADDVETLSAINIIKKFGNKIFEFYKTAKRNYEKKEKANVFLTTAHTSKGLEFDKVVILNNYPIIKKVVKTLKTFNLNKNDKQDCLNFFRKNINLIPASVIDEINLYYVALTRAKVIVDDRTIYKNIDENTLNTFIQRELEKK